MLNRRVRQIQSQENKESQTKTFGDYSEFPNIVLLGDPGAGKTHLFKQFAAKNGATYLKVRQFINGVPLDGFQTLFIDALDEKGVATTVMMWLMTLFAAYFPYCHKRSESPVALRTGWVSQISQHFCPILSGQGDMSFYICSSYQGKSR